MTNTNAQQPQRTPDSEKEMQTENEACRVLGAPNLRGLYQFRREPLSANNSAA
jgi:hypothetical protein